MATAEQYADWIVRNADKKGTPEFATVAAAYQAAKQEQPAAVTVGETLRDIPRQAGLVGRTAVRAATALPGLVVDAATGVVNAGADAIAGKGNGFRFKTTRSAVDDLMTRAGVPEPKGANERVITDAGEMLLGTGAIVKAADKAAQLTTGVGKRVAQSLAANPVVQGAGAVGAGAAGGSVREAGGSPAEQFVAALVGGVSSGVGAAKTSGMVEQGVNAIKRLTQPKTQLAQVDNVIQLAIDRSGIDWAQLSNGVKQSLRQEVADAMNTGRPLNQDAIRRLVVFREAGVTPTVGQLTQNPSQITREMNLAKTGANSTDASLQRLPALQNENTGVLLRNLDQLGAARAPQAADASRAAIGSLRGLEAQARARINNLYGAARDSSGRSLPLEGGTFTRRAGELLDEANVGSFLPADIRNRLNAIAQGTPGYELNVSSAEQLKTSIGNLQRNSADGNVRTALGLVRQALDETPLQNSQRVNPGSLPAVPGTVPPSTAAGQQSIDAFNAARTANREWMQRIERNPALAAVVDGVEPDQFVQRFVVGKGATAADVRALRGDIDAPTATEIRNYLVKYLRDAATNSTDDVTKFSNSAYRKALRDIGDDKLAVFFDPAEIQRLKAYGEAAKYMQAQPSGSAVNNSNSGALVLGRGLDFLDRMAEKVPFGFRDVIKGTVQGQQQRQALTPRNALTIAADPRGMPMLPVNPLVALTVSPVQARENDRRN